MKTLVGTASWTDKTLIDCGRFYPKEVKTPEARLRFYASIFPLVEVDSSYYAMPSAANAQRWAERTPDGFVFNMKAFRIFTGHAAETKVLPAELGLQLGIGRRVYYKDVGEDVQEDLWQRFAGALEPLRAAGKLGMIHFQFPPWVTCVPKASKHVEQCIARLPRDTLSIEFRHKSWWEGAQRTASTLAWLREIGAVHTVVDGPQGADNSVPAVWEATHPDYTLLRLHGRNVETYNAPAKSAAERFEYEYSDEELRGLAVEAVRLAYKAKHAHIIFNNCDEDKGQRNGINFMKMLLAHG